MQSTQKNKKTVQLEFKFNHRQKVTGLGKSSVKTDKGYIRILNIFHRLTEGRSDAVRVKTNMANNDYYGGYSE
jgi:hypothetical protein